MFKKLNDNLDKLQIFKKGVKSLPDIQMVGTVQQKLKQFGEALGFVQVGLESKDNEAIKNIEDKKLEKFSKQKNPTMIENEYIQAASDDIYRHLLEMN